MKFLAALLLLIMSTSIATGDGLKKIEVLEGWKKSDGSIVYGLKISLKDGWKTYWHTPGLMGLKPQFNFDGSLNIDSLNVLWPSPKVFGSSGFEFVGYENEVILPIIIQAKVSSNPVNLKIKGRIGICYDVCVPIEFETQSESKTLSRDINTDLLAALANLPLSPSDLDKSKARCTITFGPKSFEIEADIPFLEKESSNIFFSIKGYRDALSIEQPKQFTPGKIISASGGWYDKPNVKISSDLITITQIDEGQVIEQEGC